ncbi:MAG: alpha-amylase family glycosyl hydrolase [Myxococcaceae bacterium]
MNEGYFDALGVKTIWISPVDANPDDGQPGSFGKLYAGYHGYWPSKARTIQPRFGTMDELKALTSAAHARGIRVVSDLVLNHVHEQHPYFTQHKDEGWFHTGTFCVCGEGSCDWDVHRLDCWFAPYLPDFNWRNNSVADQLQSDAMFWLKEGDLDGFRMDAVKHFEHSGSRAIAGAVHQISARTGIQYLLIGETFTGVEGRPLISEYINRNELSGQFDFPLYWPIMDAIAKGGPLTALDQAAKLSDTDYPAGAINSVFIGNHDVPRFISTAAGQVEADAVAQAWGNRPPDQVTTDEPFLRARDAFAIALTLPGVPLIYYGDEVGTPGAGDPDNRRMMKFGAQLSSREAALLNQVQKIGSVRPKVKGLQTGARTTLLAETDLWVYQRDDASQPALVVIDREATDRSVTITLSGEFAKLQPESFTDVLSGRTATLGGSSVTLPVTAHSAAIWVPTDAL